VIHRFVGQYVDGATPIGGLVEDPQGNLYGTTSGGGLYNCGTIFRISNQKTEKYDSFAPGVNESCPAPYAGLIRDPEGNLYGTTVGGGFLGTGSVFEINLAKFEFLYSFCADDCIDGSLPEDSLLRDAQGNLFGTTVSGGAIGSQPPCGFLGCGVVFKVDPNGIETVLYTFSGGPDGGFPVANVIEDSDGNLYGTTMHGGTADQVCSGGCGVIFKVTSAGQETVLHQFGGGDGSDPTSGLVQDAQGNLYGTASAGGKYNAGVVFRLSPQNKLTVVHSFGSGTDGAVPYGGLIRDEKTGNFYGTTVFGGNPGCGSDTCGTVFGISAQGKETVLHRFSVDEGTNPFDPLIIDASGALYGTTSSGAGTCGTTDDGACGSVFKLIP
jgi:uncharacterized repeat protein (TIGR03803 family)